MVREEEFLDFNDSDLSSIEEDLRADQQSPRNRDTPPQPEDASREIDHLNILPPLPETGSHRRITLKVEGSILKFRSSDRRVKLGGKLYEKKSKMEGRMGGNHQAKGEVTWVNGTMFFRDKHFPDWTKGAYHDDYRKEFIDEDAQNGAFAHAPARGKLEADETSFIDYQKDWGGDKLTWKNIKDEEGRQILLTQGRPYNLDTHRITEYWFHNGTYLLDVDNHPLRWLPDLNRAFSSAIEGWRLDALRKRHPWLLIQDIRGRMPRYRLSGTRLVPIQSHEALTNRAYRFRLEHNIPDWNLRGGGNASKRVRRSQIEAQMRIRRATDCTEEIAKEQDEESIEDSASEEERYIRRTSGYIASSNPALAIQDASPNLPRRLHRSSLPLHVRPIFDRQMALERARGTAERDIRLVPLFATTGARDQTALNNSLLTNPWRVARAWRRRDITATGGHLVIRPHNAPRAVDPDTGGVLDDVADLSQEDIERLREEDEAFDIGLDWFDA